MELIMDEFIAGLINDGSCVMAFLAFGVYLVRTAGQRVDKYLELVEKREKFERDVRRGIEKTAANPNT